MQISLMDLLAAVNAKEQVQLQATPNGATNSAPSETFALVFAELRGALIDQAGLSSDTLPESVSTNKEATTEDVEGAATDGETASTVESLLAALNASLKATDEAAKAENATPVQPDSKATEQVVKLVQDAESSTTTKAVSPETSSTVPASLKDLVTRLAEAHVKLQGNTRTTANEAPSEESQLAASLLKGVSKAPDTSAVPPQQQAPSESGSNVVKESFQTTRVSALWTPAVKAETSKGETKVPVKVDAPADPAPVKVSVQTEKVSPAPAASPEESVPPQEEAELHGKKQAGKDFPSDLRVARLVREVNPDLSRQLNAVVTHDPGQAPVQTLNGSDFSAVPVTKASEVTTTGTDTATREPVQTQVVAKVPLTEVGKTVVRQVRMTGLQQDRTVTVKLIPESLGEVHLEIRTHGDETTVRMASNNAAVRDTLESQMHLLREALMREGVDVHKVHVTSSLAANNGAPAGQHQTHSQQQPQWGDGRQHGSSHQQRGGESFQQGNHAPDNPRQNARNDGSLNLFV